MFALFFSLSREAAKIQEFAPSAKLARSKGPQVQITLTKPSGIAEIRWTIVLREGGQLFNMASTMPMRCYRF